MIKKIQTVFGENWVQKITYRWLLIPSSMIIVFMCIIVLFYLIFCIFYGKNCDFIWFSLAFLLCLIIGFLLAMKISMPYFLKKAEDEKNRENKLLSMIQQEYEQDHLEVKTNIENKGKRERAEIDNYLRENDFRRQRETKQEDYNLKVQEVVRDLYKAYISSQGPQALSNQQIISQLIQSIINKK